MRRSLRRRLDERVKFQRGKHIEPNMKAASPQRNQIEYVAANPGKTTKELARHFGVRQPAIYRNLLRFVDQGYAYNVTSPRYGYVVTTSGREFLKKHGMLPG